MLAASRSSVEVAVELPFTIVFEPPSWSELRAQLRMRGHWVAGLIVALTIGTAYLLSSLAHADAVAASGSVPLALTSQPVHARVWVDGRERGATPLKLMVEPGAHTVVLKAHDAQDAQYSVDVGRDGAALAAVLWRHQLGAIRLRPALPGASLADARLLDDGTVGLSIALPPGGQLEAWRLDPSTGALESVLTNVAGPRVVFAPDGLYLAHIGSEIGPPSARDSRLRAAQWPATMVWLFEARAAAPTAAWRAPLESSEELVDASWSPQVERLLVLSKQVLTGGGVHSRGWLVERDTQHAQQVLSLPSEIVPGSEAWSPDGRAVAFVAHAGELNALCLLRLDGGFQYVADLDPSSLPPLGYPPLAWSADGQRLVFVAPHQHPPGAALGWLQRDTRHAVYIAGLDDPTPVASSDTDMDMATWREDGQLLGLGRGSVESPLSVRLLNRSGGSAQPLVDLPLRPPSRYAALWNVRQARLLVASQAGTGGIDYWLVSLGTDGEA
jgi:PEGA domain